MLAVVLVLLVLVSGIFWRVEFNELTS